MLTYEAKREVLEAYLRSNLRHCEDECCWVCDLDDNFVYFYFKDMHYSAPYVITEDAMGNGIAVVNLEAKQPVVHSWSVFSEDEKEDDKAKANMAKTKRKTMMKIKTKTKKMMMKTMMKKRKMKTMMKIKRVRKTMMMMKRRIIL